MKKRILSLCMVLALCLSLLPLTALAVAPNGQVIYVGNENVTSGGYWTTDSEGKVTSAGATQPSNNYIHYDAGNNTLTLHNATIKEEVPYNTSTYVAGAAIGVHNQNGAAELTITLEGTNTIAEVGKGIYVLANSTGGATLTITGDGSLDASASQTGIWVQSNNGNGDLFIQNAKVEATGTNTAGYGVNVQSSNSSTAALTVDGGSLTASGSPGILYDSIGSGTVPKTTALTISNSAIVDARGGGIGAGSTTDLTEVSPTDISVGIVFGHDRSDSKAGTVYGEVTLQEDLTIGEDENLNIPSGASLTIPEGTTLTVDGGELKGNVPQSGVVHKVMEVKLDKTSLTLEEGGTATLTATVEPDGATDKSVTWTSSDTNIATVDATGNVTAVGAGTATITVTTVDGGKSATCTVTVTAQTNDISANPTTLNFDSVREDYVIAPTAQTITITNKGNQTINLNQPTANNFIIGTLSKTILASNEVATFTVQPKTNLEAGTYNEIITITGDNGASTSVTVSFVVTEKPYIPPYRPTDDSIGLSGITVDSEDKVDVEEVSTDRDVRDALGRDNIITTIQVKETDKPVEVTVEAGRDYRDEIVYVVQKNADDELVLVTVVEADSRGDIVFITESIEELTLTTYLPEGFINDVDGNTYYIKEDSEVAYGWLKLEDGWYFFDYETGIQQKDRWVAEYTDWYCLDANGRMFTSAWIARDSKLDVWYYVDEDGLMLTDTTTPDGYYVDAQGIWQA